MGQVDVPWRSIGHDGAVHLRVMTWNLQGSARPDLAAVLRVIEEVAPDVVLAQEVQRWQARQLASALGWHHEWAFKHWAFVVPAEGLALLSPQPLVDVERTALALRWRFWSWRRRIALTARLDSGIRVVDTHLGAGVGDRERRRQAEITIGLAAGATSLVGGDLNTRPGSTVLDAYASAGFVDAWTEVRAGDEGATNWPPGPRIDPPSQRLDYVLTSGCDVVDAYLPSARDHLAFGAISDHVPLVVDLRADVSGGRG